MVSENPSDRAYVDWIFDPQGQGLYREVGDGTRLQVSIETLSNGNLRQVGRSIINATTGRFAWTLPSDFSSRLTVLSPGRYLVVNTLDQSRFQNTNLVTSQVIAHAELQYMDSNGNMQDLEIPYLKLTTIGKSLYVNDTVNGPGRYVEIGIDAASDAAREAAIKSGYSRASVDEALSRSVASYLLRYKLDDMQGIANSNLKDENGNDITTASGAAFWVSRQNINNVNLFVRGVIDTNRQEVS